MTTDERAMQILNALAPLSRRDEWWATDGPIAVIERELQRLYPPPPELKNLVDYARQQGSLSNYGQGLSAAGKLVR